MNDATRFLAGPAPDGAPAIFDEATGRWLSHGALRSAVTSLAVRLRASPPGLAFLFCRNTAPTVIAYLALVEAGHAVALLDGGLAEDFRERLIAQYRPDLLLEDGPATFQAWARLVESLPIPIWRSRLAPGPAPHPDLAVLLSTSGSTGSPKLVRLSRANVEANARAIAGCLAIGPEERAIASLPLQYAYGLSVLNSHLVAGASLVLTQESVVGEAFWRACRDQGCTSFAGVPYTYQLLDRLGFERVAPPALMTLTQAGGKLDAALASKFHALMQARGGRFFTMYGQTEATARIACLPSERLPEKLGAAGMAIPGGKLRIEAGGRALAPGEVGEVVYEGPNVMLGYARSREDLARGDDQQGRLLTGDLGYLDAEGFLFLTGRSKRIAKLFGLRLNLDEVEARLRAHGPAAVIEDGDRLLAFCEYGDAESLGALRKRLAGEIKLHASALHLKRVEALPLTASGKIDYARLKEGL